MKSKRKILKRRRMQRKNKEDKKEEDKLKENQEKENGKFPLVQMGVPAPVSAHAQHSAQPPIILSRIFGRMCLPKNKSPPRCTVPLLKLCVF